MATPSGTVTILSSDMEGTTGLWDAAPDATLEVERRDAILCSTIDEAGAYAFSAGGRS